MPTQLDCPDCDTRPSASQFGERWNPDEGLVTAWYFCPCCRRVTRVVAETTGLAPRAA